MFEKMKELIAEQLGAAPEDITVDSSFKDDLGADSLDLFELDVYKRQVKDHRRTAVLRDYFIGHRQRGRISSHHSVPLYHAEAEATI